MAIFTGSTALSNLITPKVFLAYLQRQSSATNRLINSNLTTQDPIVEAQLLQQAQFYTTPLINDLSGVAQQWNDTSDITVNSLSSGTNLGVKLYQAKAFGQTDFGTLVTGAPTAATIASRFTAYWNRQDERLMIATLINTFLDANLNDAKSYGLGSEAELSAGGLINAIARLGDLANPQTTTVVVNSAAYQMMRKLNLVDTNILQSDAGAPIATYQGMQILQDDAIPADSTTGITSMYIAGQGAICNCSANPENAVEVQRDATGNGGQEAVVNRRIKCIQVMNTSFKDATKAASYSLAALEAANSAATPTGFWELGSNDPRNVNIVRYSFTIDKDLIVSGINSGQSDNGTNPLSEATDEPGE